MKEVLCCHNISMLYCLAGPESFIIHGVSALRRFQLMLTTSVGSPSEMRWRINWVHAIGRVEVEARRSANREICGSQREEAKAKMIDDQDLGFFANFLGIFIFILVIAYHYVMADPKYEGN
ncbi:hypothetical protein OPV22_009122 [Ensete ventricosum]|uniref:Dolichyl-diphosphooligosaccharide--protein glycosyltransferase subunit 4 n=1 Tax=Ensete ventricosum TaxID=4639 RepID=A0AAV8RAA4_ENSVE|nr:hypothetical protein OPV22_009122 [Ensete ventricosum]